MRREEVRAPHEVPRLLLFDLDGTLLRSDKTISARTLVALERCRARGMWIGVCTSRSEPNALSFLKALSPEVVISSAGALVRCEGEIVYQVLFTAEETRRVIRRARDIAGEEVALTVDAVDGRHYYGGHFTFEGEDENWKDDIRTDFADFDQASLKICAEIFDKDQATAFAGAFPDCDMIRFSDGYWYKLTKNAATKEDAIRALGRARDIPLSQIMAFGDDHADIGMLRLVGTGVAMGNAIPEVQAQADLVIGDNDAEAIADLLERTWAS